MPPTDLVPLARIGGAYGVKGWARVEPFGTEQTLEQVRTWWLQTPQGPRELTVTGTRWHGGALLAKWDGCDTPETADALRGATIAIPRSQFAALEAGEYYWVDLIGARVFNRAGDELGQVTGLRNNGAQDLLEIVGPHGSVLVPVLPQYVDEVDTTARVVRVDWDADW